MCKAFDDHLERGRREGKAEGLKMGKAEGLKEGKAEALKNLMKNLKVSLEQAMELLDIPAEDKEKYFPLG